MNKLNYFIFDTHLPAVVIPAQAGAGMTEFDDMPYLKLSMFAMEMGSSGVGGFDCVGASLK